MPQQVMSQASAMVAQSIRPISRPTTVHRESIVVRAKGGENSRKAVESLKELSQKQSPPTLSLKTIQALAKSVSASKIPHSQRKPP